MGSARSLEFVACIPENSSRLRRIVAPLVERLRRKKFSYSVGERRAALRHVELLFDARWHGPLPRAPVVFRPPAGGPVAEEFIHEDDPIRAFRDRGPVGWQRGLQAYFNGWKISSEHELRMAALVHEFAHLLFAQEALRNNALTFDSLAYTCATEGIATYAEKEWLRSSGYTTPLLKKAWKALKEAVSSLLGKFRRPGQKPGQEGPEADEYLLGARFFEAVSENVGGHPSAFHLIASNLPRSMLEIEYPGAYLHRAVGEYGLQN